jgi:hypothetical protein
LNAQKALVLEDRLSVLDKLEALRANDPSVTTYTVRLADFPFHGAGAAAAASHFNWLQTQGVASFIFPEGTNDWNFWDIPVRIKELDDVRLRELQDQTRSELNELEPSSSQMISPPLVAEQQPPDAPMSKFSNTNRKMVKLVVSLVGFLASVAIVVTFIIQMHW